MTTTLKDIVDRMNELKETMRSEGQKALKDSFVNFFNAHDEVKSIEWRQYTPFFNDGDACTFSVHDFELRIDENIDSTYEGESSYQHGDGCYVRHLKLIDDNESNRASRVRWPDIYRRELRELTDAERSLVDDFDAMKSLLYQLDELFLISFGDHVSVVATRDGFSIDEIDHD